MQFRFSWMAGASHLAFCSSAVKLPPGLLGTSPPFCSRYVYTLYFSVANLVMSGVNDVLVFPEDSGNCKSDDKLWVDLLTFEHNVLIMRLTSIIGDTRLSKD